MARQSNGGEYKDPISRDPYQVYITVTDE